MSHFATIQEEKQHIGHTFDYVIIGGGIAGVTCCEELIKIESENVTLKKSIALISGHKLLKGIDKLNKVSPYLMDIEVKEYSHKQFISKYNKFLNLSIIQGFVVNIDNKIKKIYYYSIEKENKNKKIKKSVFYNKCLIATGGSPKLFNVISSKKCKQHSLIHALRDSETVYNFSQILSCSDNNNIMIVGNGGISLELVYTLMKYKREKKFNIIWVIKHNHIGNTFLDRASAAFLLPSLFPKNDPKIGKERIKHCKIYDNIYKKQVSLTTSYGGAVGPRWVSQLSHIKKQKPLWMEHTETYNDNDGDNDGDNDDDNDDDEMKDNEFSNELILKLNCDISSIEEYKDDDINKLKLKVSLSNGDILIIDELLCAMGVIPNTLFCDDKIFNKTKYNEFIVNEYLETNINDIYSAGDCCHIKLDDDDDIINNNWFQMNLWSQSQKQGYIAAHSMSCNINEKDDNLHLQFNFELFAHITTFFDTKCIFLGKYYIKKDDKNNNIQILMRIKPTEEFIKLVTKNGRVIGAVLIGNTDLEETFENLILNKTDISCYGDDFLNFNVDLEDLFD